MNARAYCAVFATDTVSVACHGYRNLPRNCCSSISSSKLRTPGSTAGGPPPMVRGMQAGGYRPRRIVWSLSLILSCRKPQAQWAPGGLDQWLVSGLTRLQTPAIGRPCDATLEPLRHGSGHPRCRGGVGFHCGEHARQPCCLFWAQSLIACSLVSSLRRFNRGTASSGISSPNVTSSFWLQRS